MPPSRTVAPYSPAWTPKRRGGYGSRAASGSFIRDTNLLERSLGEVNRRTKVIGRFPGETSCLSLVWAVLDLYITHAKNGVRFSQLERQRLRRIRHAGSEETTDQEVSAA
jgi:transposase-like protein